MSDPHMQSVLAFHMFFVVVALFCIVVDVARSVWARFFKK